MTDAAIRTPRSTEAATALLARYAEVDAQRGRAEADRQAEIGRINAAADAEVAPLVEQLDAMRVKLETWFGASGKALLPKSRKSMQLGGCEFGTRASSILVHGFANDDLAVDALKTSRFAKLTLRVKLSIDRVATKKLLQVEGRAKAVLTELGFRLKTSETFFVERVEQGGVIAPGT